MKKLALVILAVSISLQLFAQDQFVFSGKIIGDANVSLNLSYINIHGKHVNDSCVLRNGQFRFKGEISAPQMVFLTVYKGHFKLKSDDPNTVSFFLEPGIITGIGGGYNELKKVKITGSKTQEENEILEKQLEPFDGKIYEDKLYQYILIHPKSYVSAFRLTFYSTDWPLSTVKLIYNKFSPIVQNSIYGQEIKKEITAIDNSAVGKKAVNFNSVDINGRSISLSSFKGHYVLLDFWASWCVPCRKSIPHLKSLFKKYNKTGLAIIAIANDDFNPGNWKKAVKKDKTEQWNNILSGTVYVDQDINNSISINKQYAVNSLPTKILIDKNGMIIGRYTENLNALDNKLAALFN